uniref:Uncharacterized protein n=1 Tax=Tetraselmis chuii TaxID=63592 RepID=A0A7S1SIX0_9CHLO|mmetsp:Transcript_14738/g.26066  ORF Transcript_14738/g.26066 Transcript_14738/m.26066 type:complete len:227 (+) Transcript_14738:176-856(+)
MISSMCSTRVAVRASTHPVVLPRQRGVLSGGCARLSVAAPSADGLLRLQPVRAAATTEAAPVSGPVSSPTQLRELLIDELGWQPSWALGVVDEAKRGKLTTSVEVAREAANELAKLGLSVRDTENVVSKVPGVLATSPAQLQAVINYLRDRGVTVEEARKLVMQTPRVLLYTVSAEGAQLGLGRARMEVDVTTAGEQRRVVVSTWREGAAFESSPVSPWRPLTQKS